MNPVVADEEFGHGAYTPALGGKGEKSVIAASVSRAVLASAAVNGVGVGGVASHAAVAGGVATSGAVGGGATAPRQLDGLRLADLRSICKKVGLPVSGKKDALCARLQEKRKDLLVARAAGDDSSDEDSSGSSSSDDDSNEDDSSGGATCKPVSLGRSQRMQVKPDRLSCTDRHANDRIGKTAP